MSIPLLEYVASKSVVREAAGWRWCFDCLKDTKWIPEDRFPQAAEVVLGVQAFKDLRVKAAIIVGDRSAIVPHSLLEYCRHELGDQLPIVSTPDAGMYAECNQCLGHNG